MDPSERVNANALANARAFLNQDRPRPSHAEILKKFQTKKRFKGVLLLASTYLRHVVAAGLLPEPHDVNEVFRYFSFRQKHVKRSEDWSFLLSELALCVGMQLQALEASTDIHLMNASLLGQQVARHILLGDVKMQLVQDMLTMRLAIDFGQDILWKGLYLSMACKVLWQYRSAGADLAKLKADTDHVEMESAVLIQDAVAAMPQLVYEPPPDHPLIHQAIWNKLLDVGMRKIKLQEWPTPLEAVQHMLRLMFTMLIDHLIIQAICEAYRPLEPLCELMPSAQQIIVAHGLESPSYSAMHQLWTDLEAAEQRLDEVYSELTGRGMDPILAASYAMLHTIVARRLQRYKHDHGLSTEWASRGAGTIGSSGLPKCSLCGIRDHICKPFQLNVALLTVAGLVSIDDHVEMGHHICPAMWASRPEYGHVWDAAGKETLSENTSFISFIYVAMDEQRQKPLTMHKQRKAVKDPRSLVRTVLRQKVAQMKSAAELQLQSREPVAYQPPFEPTPKGGHCFVGIKQRLEEQQAFNAAMAPAGLQQELSIAHMEDFLLRNGVSGPGFGDIARMAGLAGTEGIPPGLFPPGMFPPGSIPSMFPPSRFP